MYHWCSQHINGWIAYVWTGNFLTQIWVQVHVFWYSLMPILLTSLVLGNQVNHGTYTYFYSSVFVGFCCVQLAVHSSCCVLCLRVLWCLTVFWIELRAVSVNMVNKNKQWVLWIAPWRAPWSVELDDPVISAHSCSHVWQFLCKLTTLVHAL